MTTTKQPLQIETSKVSRSRLATGPGGAWTKIYRVVDGDGREVAGWGTPLSKCRRIVRGAGK